MRTVIIILSVVAIILSAFSIALSVVALLRREENDE